jgi:N-acetylmuramoyl-L-alanine amidase
MKTILLYLLQVIISSGILYGYYHFFLRNKKFHQYNRYYLLLAMVISISIPFLRIPVYFDSAETEPMLSKTLTVFSYGNFEEDTVAGTISPGSGWFGWKNILSSLYVLMAVFLLTRFCVALIRIVRLVKIYPGEKVDNIRFINTSEPSTPFSFFRWLFWNNKIELNSDNGQQIFRHELFHIREKHSWDIIFTEIITILFWLNPFFHLIKKEIRAIHEFLADKFAVEENREWNYAELLLMQVLGSPNTRLTNPFFHNQIKRRIAMLTTSKKPGAQYLRKIMVLPFAVIIVGLFAFSYKNRVSDNIIPADEEITIVVDASHGGNDPGATSPDNRYNESEISLEIAKRIQDLAKEYHIKVVMTRENDEFPGGALTKDEALRKRVEITNKIKPVAFISIHLNTASPNKEYTKKSGIEAYVSNNRNDDAGKKLASVMLQNLAEVYTTKQELNYRSQSGIWVLDQTNCPSMLLECGFINNAEDLSFITNKSNQDKIARKILESVVKFRSRNFEMAIGETVIDTVPPKVTKKTIFVSHADKVTFQADSIIYHKPGNNATAQNFDKSLVIINGKKEDPGVLKKMTIIADEVHIYAKRDPEAYRLYGSEAREGLLIFKNAKLVSTPPGEYYKEELNRKTSDHDNKVFDKVEIESAFEGGEAAWKKYLSTHLKAFIPVDSGAPAGNYRVTVQFIVDQEGDISEIRPLTKHGFGMEEEVIRIIKNGPKWLPAIQNGRTVKAYRKQSVTFSIEEEKNSGSIKKHDAIKPNNEVVLVGYSPGIKTEKPVFEKTEIEPAFPGGNAAWSKYLERNSNPMVPIDNGAPAGVYKVEVLYIVNIDGSVSDIKALTNHGYGMEAEAIRLIKNSPNWIPGLQNGKKVNAYRKQPITFLVEEGKQGTSEIPAITLAQLKNSSPHSLLRLNKDVTLVSYQFSMDDKAGSIHESISKGLQFSTATNKLINQAEKGRLITIERIVGLINGKETKLPAVVYKVI